MESLRLCRSRATKISHKIEFYWVSQGHENHHFGLRQDLRIIRQIVAQRSLTDRRAAKPPAQQSGRRRRRKQCHAQQNPKSVHVFKHRGWVQRSGRNQNHAGNNNGSATAFE